YRLSNMIVVAATDQNDALASYSDYGATTVDLAAPGSNILSTQPSTVSFQVGGTTYNSAIMTFSSSGAGISGNVVDCGSGNSASEFPASVRGNLALIQRGTETFATKVTNAMAAGAKAAIIYNNVAGTFGGTLGSAGNWIPTYSISQADGQTIKAALPRTGAFVITTANYQFLDGTSMAAPHVAGAVSFAAMNFPADTVAQRRARILAAVDVKSSLQGKVVTNGRLNLLRIVDADGNGLADWQPVITTTTLPRAISGQAYSQPLTGTNGSTPYVWSIASGSLPAGLMLSGSGVLSGTSTAFGVYPFTVQLADSLGTTATKALTLAVTPDHFTWDYTPTSVYAGTPFAVKLTARDSAGHILGAAGGTVNLTASAGGSISPSSVTITDGSFLGYLTIGSAAANLTITATQNGLSATSGSLTANSGTSTANDGIPDAWKTANGLGTTTAIASVDGDGDGLTNLQEYAAGTDPQSSSSALKITSTDTDGRTYFTLNFPGIAGKLYRVSTSTDLKNWTSSTANVLPTVTGSQSVTVPLSSASRAFFRVEIAP
ncbi:MAG: PA domain-containing protein, partial [Chthoniobacterales bacterium]